MYWLQQITTTTNVQLVNNLKARVEVVKEIGGLIGYYPKLIEDELGNYFK